MSWTKAAQLTRSCTWTQVRFFTQSTIMILDAVMTSQLARVVMSRTNGRVDGTALLSESWTSILMEMPGWAQMDGGVTRCLASGPSPIMETLLSGLKGRTEEESI